MNQPQSVKPSVGQQEEGSASSCSSSRSSKGVSSPQQQQQQSHAHYVPMKDDYVHQIAEGSLTPRQIMLSPSATAVADAAKVSNNSENNTKRSSHQFHRWPSYALDVVPQVKAGETTLPADNVPITASFLFADQIDGGNFEDLPTDGDGNDYNYSRVGHRRVPINILKLPWQHPFRHHESNRNPYKIPRALFAALFLTTTLALFSAWDAQNHCVSNETDALMALLGENSATAEEGGATAAEGEREDGMDMDDETAAELSENAVLAVKATCRQMFQQVMLPVGLVTGAGSLLALGILRHHQKSYASHKGAKAPLISQSPPCFYYFYLPLLFVSGLILAAWTVGIILVMLRPRNNDTDNPYTSLAAVDSMGRVADNANLYYLSWMSEGLAILIFYQLLGAFVRQNCPPVLPTPTVAMTTSIAANPSTVSTASSVYFPWQRHRRASPVVHSSRNSMDNSLVELPLKTPQSSQHTIHGTLPPTTQRYNSSRIKWFQTFYGLRVRTGIWVAAMLSSLVVVASSAHLFNEVLVPAAQSLFDDDDYLAYDHHNNWWNIVEDNRSYSKVCVILASQDSSISKELCHRTFFSLLSGFVAVILCSTAIILHLLTRRSAAADALYFEACGGLYHELALQMMATKHHHLPLRSELLLSVVLSLWLGWNALLVSGVQGPAPRVGNLYYSSWLCFLLCLRICLGCVEEYFNITADDEGHLHHEQQRIGSTTTKSSPISKNASIGNNNKDGPSYRAPELSRVQEEDLEVQGRSESDTSNTTLEQQNESRSSGVDEKSNKESIERERSKRLRRYFFLGAFSTVCAGSAFDAAHNQARALSAQEKYMMLAPSAVAILSAVLFLLCLSKVSYAVVSQSWCGGILSLLAFWTWLADLILTMHSEESWAVNGVGEIEMANLYYFSWASIITAGLQLTSYAKEAFGLKSEDYMLIVWAAMGKVCCVLLGAAGHIWHTISDQCDIIEIQNSAITFCSRTILAMIVATTGIAIAGIVVFIRVMVPLRYISARSRAHCEAVISIFLVLLFGAAAGMITGIGGPGQSVGDLYYSTWLAFWVSIGIFVGCYDQIKLEEMESESLDESSHRGADSGVMI